MTPDSSDADSPDAKDALGVDPYSPVADTAPSNAQPSSSSELSSAASPLLRVWPAVLIVAVMWTVLVVPGKLFPLTFFHFVSMQLGSLLGVVLLSIWWFASRTIPGKQRLIGFGLIALVFVGAMLFVHRSLSIIMLVQGLPVALTVMVAAFFVSGAVKWQRRRWLPFAAFASVFVLSLFFRADSMDAAFGYTLKPRWQPTAEEELLVSLAAETKAGSGDSIEVPATIGESDWAEFRGAQRDGVLVGVELATDWDSQPLKEIWRRPVGPGWSSVCVVAPYLFTQEQRGDLEMVTAYRVDDGLPVWTHQNESRFEASMGGIGPRATPTFRDGRLYVTGASGLIECLDASSGEAIWSFDLIEELSVPLPAWGFSSSPLVLDSAVIVFAGGGPELGVVALDRETGQLSWASGDGTHSYCSPQLSTIDGISQVLISTNRGLRSFQPTDGKLLWKHDWDIGEMARVTQPLVVGNAVYLGTGYGNGTMRVDVSLKEGSWSVDEKWIAPMKPYFNDCVYHDGFLYGFDGPIFTCIDAETGEKVWKRGRYGHGQVLLVADSPVLLVLSEKGELVLVKPDPEKHTELGKMDALQGVTWNHPVIANGKLFVRNAEEMVCYQLSP